MMKNKAIASLRLSEERLRMVLEGSQQGFWDWNIETGEVQRNDRWAQILGYETIKDFEDTTHTWTDLIHPDDRDAAWDSINAHLEGRTPFHQMEYRMLTKDGGVRWILDHAKVVQRDDKGKPLRMSGTHIDITDRKKIENELSRLNAELEERVRERTMELAETEAKYRNLVENIMDISFQVDATGSLKYLSPQAKHYGFYPSDLEGLSFLDVIFPDDRERMASDFNRTIANGEVFPSEFRIQLPDGRICWFEERTNIQRDDSGAIVGLNGILRDITERKNADRVRIAHQKRLRQLAASLASAQDEEQRRIAEGLHDDIAQILAACVLKLGVAERAKNPAVVKAANQKIEGMLKTAIEKIRSLSFELSSSTLYKLGLREALKELCQSVSMRYDIRVKIEGDGQSIDLDATTATVLFKAARELIFNVVKHAQVKESTISINTEDNMLVVAVEDHGRGFPNDFRDEAIDTGKGMGLFMIRERLKDLGGDLHIESIPGVNTRVILSVPLGGLSESEKR